MDKKFNFAKKNMIQVATRVTVTAIGPMDCRFKDPGMYLGMTGTFYIDPGQYNLPWLAGCLILDDSQDEHYFYAVEVSTRDKTGLCRKLLNYQRRKNDSDRGTQTRQRRRAQTSGEPARAEDQHHAHA